MRKTLFGLVAACALSAAWLVSFASAATVNITITPTGFVPRNVTIRSGDTVTWRNTDTVAHQVVVSGASCNITIQPAQSGSCVFRSVGRHNYSEPARNGNAWRGSITVQRAALSVTVAASRLAVLYGGTSTLSGAVSNGQQGERVNVFARACGASTFTSLGTATTGANGAWTFAAKPSNTTAYQVRWRGATSATATVRVAPTIRLRKTGARRFSVRVTAAQSFAGRVAVFQRFNGNVWVRVRFVVLRQIAAGPAPTVISGRTFRANVRRGVRIRVQMGQNAVGGCYIPGKSNLARA